MEDIAQIYKALSEQMRLRILMLLTKGELCVCDIMAVLEEPQSKVSRHIAYLKNSGLIQGKRVGTWMHYFLKDPPGELAAAHIKFLRKELSGLDWVMEDIEKMEEFQKKKLCEESSGGKPASRDSKKTSKVHGVKKKRKKTNS